MANPEECTSYFLDTGTCHWEGYRFSTYCYKQRYQVFNFGIRNGTDFQDSGVRFLGFGILYRINWYKVGYTFPKTSTRNGQTHGKT